MLAWLPLLGAVGLTRDGAEMDAQSLAASLLAQQHAAEAHQRHMHHDGRAAHQKRGLPTMKELMEARQEAERHAGTVLVEPSRPGHTSGGAPHQAQPAARVVEAHERQPPNEAELEARALASATRLVQQAKAREAEMLKERKAIEGAAARFAAANAKMNEWSKEAELAKDAAEAKAAAQVVAQRAREGARATAAAEARANAEARRAAEAKAAAAQSAAAFRAQEEAVAAAAAEAAAAARHERQQAASEMAAAKAAVQRAAEA